MKNAVMYFNIHQDHKYRGLATNVILPCKNTQTYDAAFNELKDTLSCDEIVNHIVEGCSLLDDLFEGDTTYKFKEVKRDGYYGIAYVFVNSEGYELEKTFMEEFVSVYSTKLFS